MWRMCNVHMPVFKYLIIEIVKYMHILTKRIRLQLSYVKFQYVFIAKWPIHIIVLLLFAFAEMQVVRLVSDVSLGEFNTIEYLVIFR